MGKKLYVGNLSYGVDGTQLEELFSKYGPVRSAEVVRDRDTRRSKGFGFVEMADDSSASEAISGLNDREQDGRRMTVNEARPKESRNGAGFAGVAGETDDSDNAFTWQLMAGVAFALSPNLELGARYRFQHINDYTLFNSVGDEQRVRESEGHSFEVTLTWAFPK